jgi:hypothetical protein
MKPLQGIFIAPALGAFSGAFLFCLISEISLNKFFSVLFLYSIVGALFGIISAVLFGWPISLIFRKLNLVRLWHFAVGGAVCAAPFWTAWFYPFNTGHWAAFKVSNSIYFYGVGVLAGVIYWFLVVRGQHTNNQRQPMPSARLL